MAENGASAAELPIACTLSAGDGAERMRRWQALGQLAPATVRRLGHVLEVCYPARRGVREELEALAAAEAKCCAFVTWTVTDAPDQVTLRVSADPRRLDDLAEIAALFGVG